MNYVKPKCSFLSDESFITLDWLFFSRWASSTTRQAQSMEPRIAMSMVINSYEVNRTWNLIDVSFCWGKSTSMVSAHMLLQALNVSLTFILEAFFPPRIALSSKENSFSLMTARLSLSPTYVTTYISGAHISNSLSQLMIVERGALTRKGPLEWPWERAWESVHHLCSCCFTNPKIKMFYGFVTNTKQSEKTVGTILFWDMQCCWCMISSIWDHKINSFKKEKICQRTEWFVFFAFTANVKTIYKLKKK